MTTADGETFEFGVNLSLSRTCSSYDRTYRETTVKLHDPLVINYAGSTAELTDLSFDFDLDCDGEKEHLKALSAGVGAVCLDSAATAFALKDSVNQIDGLIRRSGIFLYENGQAGTVQQLDLAEQS